MTVDILTGFVLFIFCMIQHLRLRHLIKSLTNTNKALNETRSVVSTHESSIKKLHKFIEKS